MLSETACSRMFLLRVCDFAAVPSNIITSRCRIWVGNVWLLPSWLFVSLHASYDLIMRESFCISPAVRIRWCWVLPKQCPVCRDSRTVFVRAATEARISASGRHLITNTPSHSLGKPRALSPQNETDQHWQEDRVSSSYLRKCTRLKGYGFHVQSVEMIHCFVRSSYRYRTASVLNFHVFTAFLFIIGVCSYIFFSNFNKNKLMV